MMRYNSILSYSSILIKPSGFQSQTFSAALLPFNCSLRDLKKSICLKVSSKARNQTSYKVNHNITKFDLKEKTILI